VGEKHEINSIIFGIVNRDREFRLWSSLPG